MEIFQREEDDWIIDSLQKYESLYMFELQYPTRCMEWTRNGTAVCVAGFSSEHSNEIMQLSLPEKLLSLDQQTLWAKRDFKLINGAITKAPVTCLKCIQHADLLVSSGRESCATLWTADVHNSDLLVKAGEIELKMLPSLLPAVSSSQPREQSILMDVSSANLLAGSSLSLQTVQIVNIESKKTLFNMSTSHPVVAVSPSVDSCEQQSTRTLHGIKFMSEQMFVSCSREKGDIDVWDMREDSAHSHQTAQQTTTASTREEPVTNEASSRVDDHNPAQTRSNSSQTFDIAVSHTPYPSAKIAVLSSGGQLALYDVRKLDNPCAVCLCSDGRRSETVTGFRGRFSSDSARQPCVEFCSKSHSNLLSVSGLANGIQVHDTSQWSGDMQAPSPLFTHHGHEQESPGLGVNVLVHSWQPEVERGTIFSADSAGSLHAWQWKASNS